MIDVRMEWGITDYSAGWFDEIGLFLFTPRNGNFAELQPGGGLCYAKSCFFCKDRFSPMHTHVIKAEDIINCGGARRVFEFFGSDEERRFAEDRGRAVNSYGIRHEPGPRHHVTLMPGDWHTTWSDGGDFLIREVSTVNDDETDNIFRDPIGRFADIEEDTEPTHYLVSDYRSWL